MKSLIIGRFNPLCKNHVNLFKQALTLNEKLIIGLGVPDYNRAAEVFEFPEQLAQYKLQYLFDFQTRKDWISSVTQKQNTSIIAIPDIFNPKQYEQHVHRQLEKEGFSLDDVVLVGENKDTYSCFTKTPIHVTTTDVKYHATHVRDEIKKIGKSNRLAIDLTTEQRNIIINAQRQQKGLQFIIKALNESKANHLQYTTDEIRKECVKYKGFNTMVTYPTPEGFQREVLVTKDAVAILYIDEDNNAWFNKQYRSAKDAITLGVPAGMSDKKDVSDLELAVQELEEEQGIKIHPSQVSYVGTYGASQGIITEEVSLFVARGKGTYVGQKLDDGEEHISVEKIPVHSLFQDKFQFDCWRVPLLLSYIKENYF